MKAIRKCGPLTKIFLCIVFAAIILAIVHAFTETPIKEALDNASGWSAKRDEQTLTFLHKGKPVVSIDKDMGLNLGQYMKKSDLDSHIATSDIHDVAGSGAPGPAGPQGRAGQLGYRGPTGYKGPKGAMGALGAPTKYSFLFNGCCRGSAARHWRRVARNWTRSQCQDACDRNSNCNAIETNGCLRRPSTCYGNCYHFWGTRGGRIHNGGCVRNGDQKCYARNGYWTK
jgi:hypothetical protein